MLKELRISNFTLIRQLTFKPSDALTIITGETGAGKSIMLGAVGLLLGERADTKALYNPEKKGFIEGEFDISDYPLKTFFERNDLDYEDTCIIRREISPSGKSRAFINDTPSTLDIVKDLGSHLMDIHSQHDTLLLRSFDFQLEVIDSYAGSTDLLDEFQKMYSKFRTLEKDLKNLEAEHGRLSEEFDFINFQREELEKANLAENEQEVIEEEIKVLDHSEEIKSSLVQLLNILRDSEVSITSQVKECSRLLKQISRISSRYEEFAKRLESVSIELDDLSKELNGEEESVEFDPTKADELKERLSLIYNLQQKHRVTTIKELLNILDELNQKYNKASGMETSLKEAREKVEKTSIEVTKLGKKLSEKRAKAIPPLKKEIAGYLKDLGMPDASMEIELISTEPGSQGMDKISFLFSANKGVKPKPLKQVASGGEFSRLMFCLKFILAQKSQLPTVVFDEIDNGVSGEIALKLGRMMRLMAKGHQVITISHLPQIAARGNTHFFVYKETEEGKAASKIRELSEEERIEEVAKMIAGDNPTVNAFESAKELIDSN